MAVVIKPHFEVRLEGGNVPTVEQKHILSASDDEQEVISAYVGYLPSQIDFYGDGSLFVKRELFSIEHAGLNLWKGEARWGSARKAPATGDTILSFDTTGAVQHITQALVTYRYPADAQDRPLATTPDPNGMINATADSVEGTDIVVPAYNFQETHYFNDAMITPTYKGNLALLTGKVNNAAFKGFNSGEVLFVGAQGQKRGQGDWEITFRFAAQPNITNIPIGNPTNPAFQVLHKSGWEYLEVDTEPNTDTGSKKMKRKPVAAYVHTLYYPRDFSLLGIGT